MRQSAHQGATDVGMPAALARPALGDAARASRRDRGGRLGGRLHRAGRPVGERVLRERNPKRRDGGMFDTVREARVVIEQWRTDDNGVRPHAAFGYRPPAPEIVLWPIEPGGSVPKVRRCGGSAGPHGSRPWAEIRATGWRRRTAREGLTAPAARQSTNHASSSPGLGALSPVRSTKARAVPPRLGLRHQPDRRTRDRRGRVHRVRTTSLFDRLPRQAPVDGDWLELFATFGQGFHTRRPRAK